MKIVKRVFLSLLSVAVALPILFLAISLWIGPWLNDRRAEEIEEGLYTMPLPPRAEIVDSASYCGNTSGTGNHIELWAGALLRSDLPAEEIGAFYQANPVAEYPTLWHMPEDLADSYAIPPPLRDVALSLIGGQEATEGYYIVGGYHNTITQWDMRGH